VHVARLRPVAASRNEKELLSKDVQGFDIE
jgi:hypothetical protein